MKNYDIVILFHPNQSDRVPEMMARYHKLMEDNDGTINLMQDLERKKLHYTLKKYKSSKAHFLLMNVTCNKQVVMNLKESFRFNDVVMRSLIIETKLPRTEKLNPLLEKDEKAQFGKGIRNVLAQSFKPEDIYLNIAFMREFTTETGRIMPARTSGLTAKQQRYYTKAVKWSRYLGLLCYCDRHD